MIEYLFFNDEFPLDFGVILFCRLTTETLDTTDVEPLELTVFVDVIDVSNDSVNFSGDASNFADSIKFFAY